jgi:TolA-binding protein
MKYAKMLITDHPSSTLLPSAYLNMGIASYNLKDNEAAVRSFKTIVYDYCSDPKALDALEMLNTIMKQEEYDKVFQAYKEKCPNQQSSPGDTKLEDLVFNTGRDRFDNGNFESAIEQFTSYLRDYPNGKNAAESRFMRGVAFEKTSKPDQALSDYEEVYKSPQAGSMGVEALIKAGEIHFTRNNFLVGLELFSSADQKAEKLTDHLSAMFGKAKCQMGMGNYEQAKETLLSIYSDPNTTEYSRTRSYVMIGNCNYYLGRLDEAKEIFSSVQGKDKGAFGAESQYMITRILFDKADYKQCEIAAFYLKDNYQSQNYWKAKAYLVLAEDYLAMGDTLQAVDGVLESVSKDAPFPEIREEAKKRMEQINAIWSRNKVGKPEDGNGGDE